jgi:hypothetical protein
LVVRLPRSIESIESRLRERPFKFGQPIDNVGV